MTRLWCVVLPALLCAACAPVTRVILLPGAAAGANVEVATAQGETRLTTPYREAKVSSRGAVSATTSSATRVEARYGALLPLPTATSAGTPLTFEPRATTLTATSQVQWAHALHALRERPTTTLLIRSPEPASPLATARIRALQTQAVAAGIEPARIQITAPEGAEPGETSSLRILVR